MIKIENLSVAFGDTEAVKNVNLELHDGEILGVVGESGSGKSVTALTLMGLVAESARMTTGRILFDDVVLREAGKPCDRELYRRYQGAKMSMVFQEPQTSLNPTQRVGRQVEEMLCLHTKLEKGEIRRRVLETFEAVGLRDSERVYASYPHQLSGGMRQRAMIAMAIILHPRLIVADEPTTALDVTIQHQIIQLLREINEKQNNAMLFITHDLNLARQFCHRVAVMKDGCVVETGTAEEVFGHPKQEYTRRLVEAVPSRMKPRRAEAQKTADLRDCENVQNTAIVQDRESAQKTAGVLDRENAQKTADVWDRENAQKADIKDRENIQEAVREGDTERNLEPVLQVRDLSVYYQDGSGSLFSATKETSTKGSFLGKKRQYVVWNADFAVYPGESLGLVGESGCGKTSLSKAILGMNRHIEGEIISRCVRPQMVFQDPYSSLNPSKTIGWLLQEPLRAAGVLDKKQAMSKADREAAAYDMLRRVGMEEKYFHRRPSELSGGQRQRVSIAQALITNPAFIVADEPVSALDVTIQAQIMELIRRLQKEMNLACLFISHDINVVYQMCDRIMVMKDGRIVEIGETENVFRNPQEDYTKLLLLNSR